MTTNVTNKIYKSIMGNITKQRRHEIIFQILKGRDISSALSATEIHSKVNNEGIEINLRTIRRDLEELSKSHGLSSDEGRPEKYFPYKDFQFKYDLQLNENTLQVLMIALNNLKQTSHEYFENLALEAETTILNSLDSKLAQELRDSKEKYQFNYATEGRPISKNIKDFENLMFALRESRIITCKNNSPYKDKEYNSRIRNFAPHKFILNSGTPYLIVEDLDDGMFKNIRATRVTDVNVSSDKFSPKNVKHFIHIKEQFGGWGGLQKDAVEVTVICDKGFATYFEEKIIHPSQNLTKLSNNKYKLKLNCALSTELIRFFAGFGEHIESISPKELKNQIIEIYKTEFN